MPGQRPVRGAGVEGQAAAGEALRVVTAKHQVGVGNRRMGASAAVAGRPRFGASAFRADGNAAERVEMGEAAAAGADLDHLDNWNTQRQAGSLLEAAEAR